MSTSDEDEIIDLALEAAVMLIHDLQDEMDIDEGNEIIRRHRRYIQRNREEAHQRLISDYFAEDSLSGSIISDVVSECVNLCSCVL